MTIVISVVAGELEIEQSLLVQQTAALDRVMAHLRQGRVPDTHDVDLLEGVAEMCHQILDRSFV